MEIENPYEIHLSKFKCNSFPELYSKLEFLGKMYMGLDNLPFLLSDLEEGDLSKGGDIHSFMHKFIRLVEGNDAESQVIELTKYLKQNPPAESYENPVLPVGPCTPQQKNLAQFIYAFGIDLPGSKHNIYGHLQYFSSFFIDMFFGNFTEFMAHVRSLLNKELKKQLKKREGYCQFSPIFALILGIVMLDMEDHSFLTNTQKQEIRLMYSGNNENKHLQILRKLLKLGADPNVHDIHGFTPLLHAMYYGDEDMISTLLNRGANPNSESIYGFRPLTMYTSPVYDHNVNTIHMLLQYKSRLVDPLQIQQFRSNLETFGDKDLIVKVREAMPREKEVCERCGGVAEKKCSACSQVYYCSQTCQKLDWKFHKLCCNRE